ncbi:hypothetical protein TNIN_422331 [Trichonephila inaurata madagascariensis]|uniref:Uncharacterized protein n=1 Tax=Trichonephila inaurata madagascariensis TaxID=2747483 RepID=A0A8X7BP58_9ARAC|nr:hypothetical protein TNIN_422331 [Trichonephila inaurata madagascariensis]
MQQPETAVKLLFEQQFSTKAHHGLQSQAGQMFPSPTEKGSAQEVRTCWTRGFHCGPDRSLPLIKLQPPSAEELSEDPGDSSIISQ